MGVLFSQLPQLKTFAWLDSEERRAASFDVVVIGSGPAGCVLANRLSEDGKRRVLLVEAGGSNEKELFTQIPATWTKNIGSSIDWKTDTIPQASLGGRQITWSRGKVLGGSSSINALIYHHASPFDYDQWEKEGAAGWGYRDLAPYFKKAENHTPHQSHADIDLEHRGTGGPWQTGFANSDPLMQDWVKAVQALGVPYTSDFNTPRGTLGVTTISTFTDTKGHRSSAATAYLTPDVLARPNLTLLTETRCTRVLLEGNRAVGVELADERHHEQTRRVLVAENGEVFLCAGAMATPQLLLLSGLGPKSDLERLGIDCKMDLPAVGQHLQDHAMACIQFRVKPGKSLDWVATAPLWVLPHLFQWKLGWKGMLTNNGVESVAFVRTDDPTLKLKEETCGAAYRSNAMPGCPDIELLSAPATFIGQGDFVRPWLNGMTMITTLLHPESRGSVTLKSADPFDQPIVDPRYFSSLTDLQAMVRGVRLLLRIARTPPLANALDLRPPLSRDPNAKETEQQMAYGFGDWKEEDLSDDDIVKWLKEHTQTIFHASCSARMGKSPADSVVDTQLRVHGIQGLRICDASVHPSIVSGHPTAPIIAMAEKAADIVRQAFAEREQQK